jgi:hypothetical protein
MRDSKTKTLISKAEWVETRFSVMTLQECVNLWNGKAVDNRCKIMEIHEMGDIEWWNRLALDLDAWNLIHAVFRAGEEFCDADDWFFYDQDAGYVRSFCTKQELVEKIGKEFFIDMLMEQKMQVNEYGRTWEVIEGTLLKDTWFVGNFGAGQVYMNNIEGYVILWEENGRILKSDI